MRKKWPNGANIMHEYFVAEMPNSCPLCGSTNLLLDVTHGQLVCTNCGYVIDEIVFDYSIELSSSFYPTSSPKQSMVEVQSQTTMLKLMTARIKLSKKLGFTAESILEGLVVDPSAALDALNLLRSPCIQKIIRKLDKALTAAVIKAMIMYKRSGEYPLYAELALEHGLRDSDIRKLRKTIKKALKCISEDHENSTIMLAEQKSS